MRWDQRTFRDFPVSHPKTANSLNVYSAWNSASLRASLDESLPGDLVDPRAYADLVAVEFAEAVGAEFRDDVADLAHALQERLPVAVVALELEGGVAAGIGVDDVGASGMRVGVALESSATVRNWDQRALTLDIVHVAVDGNIDEPLCWEDVASNLLDCKRRIRGRSVPWFLVGKIGAECAAWDSEDASQYGHVHFTLRGSHHDISPERAPQDIHFFPCRTPQVTACRPENLHLFRSHLDDVFWG